MKQKVKKAVLYSLLLFIGIIECFRIGILIFWHCENISLFNALQLSLYQNSCDLGVESLRTRVYIPPDASWLRVLVIDVVLDKDMEELDPSYNITESFNQIRYTVQDYIDNCSIFSKYNLYDDIELWIYTKDDQELDIGSCYGRLICFSTLYNPHVGDSTFGFPEDLTSSKVLDSIKITKNLQYIINLEDLEVFNYAKSFIICFDNYNYDKFEFLESFKNLKYIYIQKAEEFASQMKIYLPSDCVIYIYDYDLRKKIVYDAT